MQTRALVLGSILAGATALPGQAIPNPPEPPAGFQLFDELGVVHMILPASWRELGPAEAQLLGDGLPPGLRVTNAGEAQVFGAVDSGDASDDNALRMRSRASDTAVSGRPTMTMVSLP